VKEDLTIRDMTDLMGTMNGDRTIIASRMTEAAITGLMVIAKTVPGTTTGMEDMATAREDIIITVKEEGTTTTVRGGTTTTVRLLMGTTTVLLMGIIIITAHTEIMIAHTIALARKEDIATGP
jgi:hypothetical protein